MFGEKQRLPLPGSTTSRALPRSWQLPVECQGVGAVRNHQFLTLCVFLGRLGLLLGQRCSSILAGRLSQVPAGSSDTRGCAAHKGQRVWRWGGEQRPWLPGETAP